MITPSSLPDFLAEAAVAFCMRADLEPEHASHHRRRATEARLWANALRAGPPPPPALQIINHTVTVNGKRYGGCRMLRSAALAAKVFEHGQADASAEGYETHGSARGALRRLANWIDRTPKDSALADRLRSITVNVELLAYE